MPLAFWSMVPVTLPAGSLPDVVEHGFDPPERLAAFLDAVRWSAVTSADVKTLQAPFRSGVAIEDYQRSLLRAVYQLLMRHVGRTAARAEGQSVAGRRRRSR